LLQASACSSRFCSATISLLKITAHQLAANASWWVCVCIIYRIAPPTHVWSEGGAGGGLSRKKIQVQPHRLAFGVRVGLYVSCRTKIQEMTPLTRVWSESGVEGGSSCEGYYRKKPPPTPSRARVGLWMGCRMKDTRDYPTDSLLVVYLRL
jgi:hypothetical protein